MLTLSQMMNPDSTQTCPLVSSPSATLEVSVVSPAPPVVETEDGVTHEIRPTPTDPHEARGLELPDPNLGIHLIGVRRPAREEPRPPRVEQSQGRKRR